MLLLPLLLWLLLLLPFQVHTCYDPDFKMFPNYFSVCYHCVLFILIVLPCKNNLVEILHCLTLFILLTVLVEVGMLSTNHHQKTEWEESCYNINDILSPLSLPAQHPPWGMQPQPWRYILHQTRYLKKEEKKKQCPTISLEDPGSQGIHWAPT